MENVLIGLGFSWTLSKIIPFVLMILLGVGIFILVRKKTTQNWIRYSSFIFILLPAVGYFLMNPIYEGDFSNNFKIEKSNEKNRELKGGELSVITIPNCPYCLQSIESLKVMSGRTNSSKNINFIVCSKSDSDLENYKSKSDGLLDIKLAKNIEAMVDLAGGRFPTFVYKNESGEMRIWSNDGFGVFAKDWIEDNL